MRRAFIYLSIALLTTIIIIACALRRKRTASQPPQAKSAPPSQNTEPIKEAAPLFIPVSDGFDYPVGEAWRAKRLTQANDGDGWYNAQDFGTNNHLGEDWNTEAGGGTDCGLPVYETLYAHLQSFARTDGTVVRRERIASIGDAGGAYPCHLHFELLTHAAIHNADLGLRIAD